MAPPVFNQISELFASVQPPIKKHNYSDLTVYNSEWLYMTLILKCSDPTTNPYIWRLDFSYGTIFPKLNTLPYPALPQHILKLTWGEGFSISCIAQDEGYYVSDNPIYS